MVERVLHPNPVKNGFPSYFRLRIAGKLDYLTSASQTCPRLPDEEQIMKCPFCGLDNDRVTDSRAGEDGSVIRRRRECTQCQRRFTTYERVAEVDMRVVKRNGERHPFQPAKLHNGEANTWGMESPGIWRSQRAGFGTCGAAKGVSAS